MKPEWELTGYAIGLSSSVHTWVVAEVCHLHLDIPLKRTAAPVLGPG